MCGFQKRSPPSFEKLLSEHSKHLRSPQALATLDTLLLRGVVTLLEASLATSTLFLYVPFKILNLLVSDRRYHRVKLDSEGEKCAVTGQGKKSLVERTNPLNA